MKRHEPDTHAVYPPRRTRNYRAYAWALIVVLLLISVALIVSRVWP